MGVAILPLPPHIPSQHGPRLSTTTKLPYVKCMLPLKGLCLRFLLFYLDSKEFLRSRLDSRRVWSEVANMSSTAAWAVNSDCSRPGRFLALPRFGLHSRSMFSTCRSFTEFLRASAWSYSSIASYCCIQHDFLSLNILAF
jgi:hypothetical protein